MTCGSKLRINIRSKNISRCNALECHLEKLRECTCTQKYAEEVSNWFEVLGALKDLGGVWIP